MKVINTRQIASLTYAVSASPAEVAQRQRTAAAVRGLNQMNIFGANRELTFTFDRATHRMIIWSIIERHRTFEQ